VARRNTLKRYCALRFGDFRIWPVAEPFVMRSLDGRSWGLVAEKQDDQVSNVR